MFGLVPGLELGLLELDPESREDCRSPQPTAERGNVAALGDPAPPLGVLVPASRVRFKCGVVGALFLVLLSDTWDTWVGLEQLFVMFGGHSEPELGRSSLEPEENQDSRHDSQLEY